MPASGMGCSAYQFTTFRVPSALGSTALDHALGLQARQCISLLRVGFSRSGVLASSESIKTSPESQTRGCRRITDWVLPAQGWAGQGHTTPPGGAEPLNQRAVVGHFGINLGVGYPRSLPWSVLVQCHCPKLSLSGSLSATDHFTTLHSHSCPQLILPDVGQPALALHVTSLHEPLTLILWDPPAAAERATTQGIALALSLDMLCPSVLHKARACLSGPVPPPWATSGKSCSSRGFHMGTRDLKIWVPPGTQV